MTDKSKPISSSNPPESRGTRGKPVEEKKVEKTSTKKTTK